MIINITELLLGRWRFFLRCGLFGAIFCGLKYGGTQVPQFEGQ